MLNSKIVEIGQAEAIKLREDTERAEAEIDIDEVWYVGAFLAQSLSEWYFLEDQPW